MSAGWAPFHNAQPAKNHMEDDTVTVGRGQPHGGGMPAISLDRIGDRQQGTWYLSHHPSGVDECTGTAHSITPEQRGRTIADVLLEAGVFTLSSSKRKSIEDAIVADGFGAQQVDRLWRIIRDGEPEIAKARRYMAAILNDQQKRREAFAGMNSILEDGGTHQRGFPCPYWTCSCEACNKARSMGRPNEGPRPDFLLDGVAPPRERIVIERAPRRSKFDPNLDDDRSRLAHLLATCKAFEEQGRKPPGHIVSLILKLHHVWSGAEIPPSILDVAARTARAMARPQEMSNP